MAAQEEFNRQIAEAFLLMASQHRVMAMLVSGIAGQLARMHPSSSDEIRSAVAAAMRANGGLTDIEEAFLDSLLSNKPATFPVIIGGKQE